MNRPASADAFFSVVTSLDMALSCLVAVHTDTSTCTMSADVARDMICLGCCSSRFMIFTRLAVDAAFVVDTLEVFKVGNEQVVALVEWHDSVLGAA